VTPPEEDSGSGESVDALVRQAKRAEERLRRVQAEQGVAGVDGSEAPGSEARRIEEPPALLGLAVLAAVMGINFAVFAAFGGAYLDWYIQSGFIVALVFAVVAIAVDLDRELRMIAAHPFVFIRGVSAVLAQVFAAARQFVADPRADTDLAEVGDGYEFMQSQFRLPTLDLIFGLVFTLIFTAAMFAWALVVAPLQYWVNLLCGAPARVALASSETLMREKHDGQWTEFVYAPKDQEKISEDAHQLKEAMEVTFVSKPVTLTAAIGAAFLWGISRFV
jgi:hypothetical protein